MCSRSLKSPKESLRNVKLTLEYDGSGLFGFQKQTHHETIQYHLECALSKLLNRKTKIASASGRTDTGVHAAAQIINFKTGHPMPLAKLQRGLNGLLPRQIAVKRAELAAPDFHARYDARGKVYEYRIWNDSVRSPLHAARTWHVPEKLNLTEMRKAGKYLLGKHDFRSFCAAGGLKRKGADGTVTERDTVRTLQKLSINRKNGLISMRFEADGFLHHMVRNLAGTLVEIGKGSAQSGVIKDILKAKDRSCAYRTAPPNALTLVTVRY